MCRVAIVFAEDVALGMEEAARAALQVRNDTASIADADAYRFMTPLLSCFVRLTLEQRYGNVRNPPAVCPEGRAKAAAAQASPAACQFGPTCIGSAAL
jgi:hypothetical protein